VDDDDVAGAVVRDGVGVNLTVVVDVVGVGVGVGVVIPTVRVPDGVWLGSAAWVSGTDSPLAETRRTLSTPATIIRKTPRPTRNAWTLPANDTSPMLDMVGRGDDGPRGAEPGGWLLPRKTNR
jgi:hypothetical protein